MTRLSGWCSGPTGCNSPTNHATCADRMARGLLTFRCGCEEYGAHRTDERDTASEQGKQGHAADRLGAQIKTAPEPPVVPLLAQRVAVEGLPINNLESR